MLPNFSIVSTNIATVHRGVSSCIVVRTLRTSSCGRLSAPHLKQYWNDPCVETVFVCSCVRVFVSVSFTAAQWQSHCAALPTEEGYKVCWCQFTLSATPYRGMNLVWRVCRKDFFLLFLCETWSLTLREERRLRVCVNRLGCWREYLGLRGTRKEGSRENYIVRSLVICTDHPVFFGWSNREEWDGRGM